MAAFDGVRGGSFLIMVESKRIFKVVWEVKRDSITM